MIKIAVPDNFDGAKFGKKYFPGFNASVPSDKFWVENGVLHCEELDDVDLSDCVTLYVKPEPKADPGEAFVDMVEASSAEVVNDKKDAMIANLIVVVKDLWARVEKFEGKKGAI